MEFFNPKSVVFDGIWGVIWVYKNYPFFLAENVYEQTIGRFRWNFGANLCL